MTEPDRPDAPNEPNRPASAPSPFDRPGPPGAREAGTGPGVGKPLLIGCGALFVLLIVAGVLFVVNESAIFAWFLEVMESQIKPLVPEELPQAERDRFDRAFERAIAATRAGQADPIAIQRAMQQMQRGVTSAAEQGADAKLSPAAVAEISEALEAVPSSAWKPERKAPGPGGAGERSSPAPTAAPAPPG